MIVYFSGPYQAPTYLHVRFQQFCHMSTRGLWRASPLSLNLIIKRPERKQIRNIDSILISEVEFTYNLMVKVRLPNKTSKIQSSFKTPRYWIINITKWREERKEKRRQCWKLSFGRFSHNSRRLPGSGKLWLSRHMYQVAKWQEKKNIACSLYGLPGPLVHSKYKRDSRESSGWQSKQHSNLRQMGWEGPCYIVTIWQ